MPFVIVCTTTRTIKYSKRAWCELNAGVNGR